MDRQNPLQVRKLVYHLICRTADVAGLCLQRERRAYSSFRCTTQTEAFIRAEQLDISRYATAPLKLSDHRPVLAVIRCKVKITNAAQKEKLSAEILGSIRQSMHVDLMTVSNQPPSSSVTSSGNGMCRLCLLQAH